MKQTVIAAAIALLAVIFAIQNSGDVDINFLFWHITTSKALLLIIVLIAGIATGLLVSASRMMKKNTAMKSANKKISELEKNISDVTNKKYN